jgi:predicted acetyltransferase
MINYQVEYLSDVKEEIAATLAVYHEEVFAFKDAVDLAPDWDTYLKMEQIGILNILTARLEGRLVGYIVSTIIPHTHYKNNTFSISDVFYINPTIRGEGIGLGLLEAAEAVYREKGVDLMHITLKKDRPSDSLMKRFGAEEAETTYAKRMK